MHSIPDVCDSPRSTTGNFLKTVFHKFYLVHFWILCAICSKKEINDFNDFHGFNDFNKLMVSLILTLLFT